MVNARNRIGEAWFGRRGRLAAFASVAAITSSLLVAGCPVATPPPTITVKLALVAQDFTAPVALGFPDDGSRRVFLVGQTGTISIIDAAETVLAQPFLDISASVVELNPGYDERGLLGLAFHPDYAANGRFYVYYIAPPATDVANSAAGVSVLSEFRVSSDPDRADATGERVLLRFGQPQANHSGGQLAFGPDGFLYISTGDGGGVGDSAEGHSDGGNAQDRSNLLGKILRIDVDGGEPYAIPPDNPFVDSDNARPEIWAYGLRNPWRFSFDQAPDGSVRLFAGDVGQSIHEEINIVQRGGNYGWRIREGTACFSPDSILLPPGDCDDAASDGAPLVPPILEYTHATGTAVIGGAVYRGASVPVLSGKYVFGDFSRTPGGSRGLIFCAEQDSDDRWVFEEIAVSDMSGNRLGSYLYGFGQDASGEMYVLTNDVPSPVGSGGRLYRIEAAE